VNDPGDLYIHKGCRGGRPLQESTSEKLHQSTVRCSDFHLSDHNTPSFVFAPIFRIQSREMDAQACDSSVLVRAFARVVSRIFAAFRSPHSPTGRRPRHCGQLQIPVVNLEISGRPSLGHKTARSKRQQGGDELNKDSGYKSSHRNHRSVTLQTTLASPCF